MKSGFLFCLLCFLALVPGGAPAWAQVRCVTPNPPACTFRILDVSASPEVEVNAMCVGRRYRFVQCPGRGVNGGGIPVGFLFYGVLPGVNNVPVNCAPTNQGATFVYTPTTADVGPVTISELSNDFNNPTYYIRNVTVRPIPPLDFRIDPCPNGFARVTITTGPYDTYTVESVGPNAGPAQPLPGTTSTVVTVPPGTTALTVRGRYTDAGPCEGSLTKPLPTLAPAQTPLFTRLELLAALPGGAAQLDVGQLPPGYRYTVQVADGSAPGGFRNVADVPAGSTRVTVPAAPAGCYRVLREDFCGSNPAQPSANTLCTLGLTGTSAAGRNQLVLADAGPGSTYAVTRNGAAAPALVRTASGFEDADVVCGTTYVYQVTGTQPGGGVSVSNPVSILTTSAVAPPTPRLVASFTFQNTIVLTPTLAAGPVPPGGQLRYRRTLGSGAAADFGTTSSSRVRGDSTDLAELLANPPCYTVRYVDVCGNASAESRPTCPSLLRAAPADAEGATVNLTWTPFSGPDAGSPATYTLQRLAPDGAVLPGSIPLGSALSYTDTRPPDDRQVVRYRVQISGAGIPPGTFSYSNVGSVARKPRVQLPNAFTPNGDGLNDVLEVKGRFLSNFVLVVVDRNGQEVFRGTKRTDTWDGSIRGRPPVNGTYVWRFQQTDEEGQQTTETGNITILK